jgi:DNA-binding MarR family transcriptional regulator
MTQATSKALRLLAFTRSGSLPMGKMGERLMVHPTSVTNAIKRLEDRGLVQRHLSPTDRRVVLATITDDGRVVATEATDALNEAAFGMSCVTREQAADMTSVLREIRVSVGDIDSPDSSPAPS